MESESKESKRRYAKAHYKKHKQQYLDRAKRTKQRRRDWYYNFKESMSCSVCGEPETCALDFHHVDGDKEFEISAGYQIVSEARLITELRKCTIVCATCHRKVHGGIIDKGLLVKLDITQLCES